jgi:acetoin utilization deacetylase AcuC-like enzyme
MREDGNELVQAPLGTVDPIIEVHDAEYVQFLKTVYGRWRDNPDYGPEVVPNVHPTYRMNRKPRELLGELGWYSNSTSCPIHEGTWPAVFASAQTAVHGAELLKRNTGPVYALCRPPGHHAYPNLMSGVCFLNNAAIAAHHLTKQYGKVAIVDIDVHHGNGTQSIFWKRSDVLFCSIHIDPAEAAPYYAGYADEVGQGPGRGLTLNLPLAPKTQDRPWLDAIAKALTRVQEYGPGALVVSLGFDASEHDPIGAFKITDDGFGAAGRRLAELALPTLLIQEGGYISPHLGGHLRSFFRAFQSHAVPHG